MGSIKPIKIMVEDILYKVRMWLGGLICMRKNEHVWTEKTVREMYSERPPVTFRYCERCALREKLVDGEWVTSSR